MIDPGFCTDSGCSGRWRAARYILDGSTFVSRLGNPMQDPTHSNKDLHWPLPGRSPCHIPSREPIRTPRDGMTFSTADTCESRGCVSIGAISIWKRRLLVRAASIPMRVASRSDRAAMFSLRATSKPAWVACIPALIRACQYGSGGDPIERVDVSGGPEGKPYAWLGDAYGSPASPYGIVRDQSGLARPWAGFDRIHAWAPADQVQSLRGVYGAPAGFLASPLPSAGAQPQLRVVQPSRRLPRGPAKPCVAREQSVDSKTHSAVNCCP